MCVYPWLGLKEEGKGAPEGPESDGKEALSGGMCRGLLMTPAAPSHRVALASGPLFPQRGWWV